MTDNSSRAAPLSDGVASTTDGPTPAPPTAPSPSYWACGQAADCQASRRRLHRPGGGEPVYRAAFRVVECRGSRFRGRGCGRSCQRSIGRSWRECVHGCVPEPLWPPHVCTTSATLEHRARSIIEQSGNSRSSSIEGRGPRAEERIGTLRNAAAFAVAVTVYFAGLGSWGVWLRCSGWSPGCRERVGCCLVSGGR